MLVLILMHSLVNMYLSLYQSYPLVSLLELNIWQSKLALHHCCQPPYLLLSDYNFMSEDNLFSFPLQSQYLLLHLSPNYCFSILKLCHLVLQLITVYAFCHLTDDDLTEETTNCHQCMILVMVISSMLITLTTQMHDSQLTGKTGYSQLYT